ncbi:multiple RNA-binding domain-containing protein 1-like [Hylaeus volcanicus]|uniref:multiple RNA-binding domain-containing protein 1-like n=1 Tax=Hylaeus volcanicus TaxID=313075 RepID=UPI0023B7E0E5|nr:multiple RNA-binding domain-containing protein 1-like [Hylaeus volcanicus]XP_053992120.1 multiple RNA-binding domain-containing protein 1-like [Hylaeus volcanicus]XP_053992121.1 multiple RNA-binding domain-containing protein 1-like [Hylaeus volcanicus]XP_053992122.1 multiple RNA-binding domain-containing protein 1-like [Hylaeus volcanicus]
MVASNVIPDGTTRLIIRNLPSYVTEDDLKKWILSFVDVKITDVRLPRNSRGRLRRIGFVGVRTAEEASHVIKSLDRGFYDTSKIICSPAFPPGSKEIPRPWSRYAPGSSAYEKYQKEKEKKKKEKKELRENCLVECVVENTDKDDSCLKRDYFNLVNKRKGKQTWNDSLVYSEEEPFPKKSKILRHSETVTPTKAGMLGIREHIQFDSDSDSLKNKEEGSLTGNQTKNLNLNVSIPSSKQDFTDENPLDWLRMRSNVQSQEPTSHHENEMVSLKTPTENIVQSGELDYAATSLPKIIDSTELQEKSNNIKNNCKNGSIKNLNTNSESEFAEDELISDTGRLLILNLPYDTTEDAIKNYFKKFGDISYVHICQNDAKTSSVGRAFIQFAFPEDAIKAAAEAHLSLFEGRIIRVKGARPPLGKNESHEKVVGYLKKRNSSYKKQLEEKLKKNAENPTIWNLLYVSANSAMESAAQDLSMSKKDVMGLDSGVNDSVAARVALGETHVIHKTKEWLQEQGIRASAFERQGISLLTSQPIYTDNSEKRSDDTIIVKHLPPNVTEAELFECYTKFGTLVRCTLAPSKTVAVIQFLNSYQAKKAFSSLAFSCIKNVPMFLEWAPVSIFEKKKIAENNNDLETTNKTASMPRDVPAEPITTKDLKHMLEQEDNASQTSSVFVKNINFSTSQEALSQLFESVPDFTSATIMIKKCPITKNEIHGISNSTNIKKVSMGYGFLEFKSSKAAKEVIKRFQGVMLDGHALELVFSQRNKTQTATPKKHSHMTTVDLSKMTNKIVVRNLAFEATKQDLRRLFESSGNVVAVRIPKKPDKKSRGYGFIEFLSRSEAVDALDSLQHTHLYGRKLILEPAYEKTNT